MMLKSIKYIKNSLFNNNIMKILISTDMEGITGVDSYNQIQNTSDNCYFDACDLLTKETNIAIEACFLSGAELVYVVDGHGSGHNILRDKLHPKAEFLEKKELRMIEGIDKGVDFLILLGYHGRSLCHNSFTAHSYSSVLISKVKVNGVEVSEGELNAAVAKFLGIKTIFISGTDKGIEELPIKNIISVITKESLFWDLAKSYDIDETLLKIKEGIMQSIREHENISFISFPIKNLVFEVEFNYAFLAETCNEKKVNQKTIMFNADDVLEGYKKLMNLLSYAKERYNQVYS
ncbi:M55 family metallopeptidase [Candidatus Woesearchaeota archaeon]|nr:M55 family metallopeptidase [Candidatus Woesearchaeota archaeon]